MPIMDDHSHDATLLFHVLDELFGLAGWSSDLLFDFRQIEIDYYKQKLQHKIKFHGYGVFDTHSGTGEG